MIYHSHACYCLFFFFNDTATTEIYTLSLHDALPIYSSVIDERNPGRGHRLSDLVDQERTAPVNCAAGHGIEDVAQERARARSEEHTSELQSHSDLVCRLLLEKKKKKKK